MRDGFVDMLADFIIANRDAILDPTRARVALRAPSPMTEMCSGIPSFLDQLAYALVADQSNDVVDHEDIGRSAGKHGHELLRRGLSIGQVVHDYGDVCQAVTALALRRQVQIAGSEFRF